MKRIGITGQHGFIGSYLYNTVSLLKDTYALVPFDKTYFDDAAALQAWASQCDVIVHLAAMNRHPDAQRIHDTNVELVTKLLEAVTTADHKPHIIFSSSTQEVRDNLYGQSKKSGRELLAAWAKANDARFTGLLIPNVYGPFGKPFYNSVVATFCHQLTHGEVPKIDQDGYLKLIHVQELCKEILRIINDELAVDELEVPHTSESYVSELLAQLQEFKTQYFDAGIFPDLRDAASVLLFNTFRSYIDQGTHFPVKLKQHADNRGVFVEMIKLQQGGQVSFSTTHPGITRGNHFHTRKIERFLVIKGKALIQLRKYNTEEVLNFELDGSEPAYVDMPVWYSHNIKNVGDDELITVFWINEFFDPADPDTYFETV